MEEKSRAPAQDPPLVRIEMTCLDKSRDAVPGPSSLDPVLQLQILYHELNINQPAAADFEIVVGSILLQGREDQMSK